MVRFEQARRLLAGMQRAELAEIIRTLRAAEGDGVRSEYQRHRAIWLGDLARAIETDL